MIYTNRQRLKKIIRSVIVVLVIILAFYGFLIYSLNKYVERGTKLHEKTSFTDQETKILWSELGLDYIDLDISKAYYNIYSHRLFVVSEGFDNIDAEIEYLKQLKGNENVHIGDAVKNEKDDKRTNIREILDIKYNPDIQYFYMDDLEDWNESIVCITYKEKGKYYLRFFKDGVTRFKTDEDFNYVKSRFKTYEKTTFTDQEKKNLWSEVGLEYIDLDISKADYSYYDSKPKRVVELYVVSEGFDSIDAELEYLKQFKGNEYVCQEDYEIDGIVDNTNRDHIVLQREYTTYEKNGKYYLKLYYKFAEDKDNDNILDKVFGIDDSGKQ